MTETKKAVDCAECRGWYVNRPATREVWMEEQWIPLCDFHGSNPAPWNRDVPVRDINTKEKL